MLRSFLPVGQGAFYLEQFETKDEKINVIYDCGSSTDIEIVKNQIRTNFNKGEEIKIVFISHLHEDHINGLEYLLKYCKVKNIVFPYTSKKDRILLNVDLLYKNNDISNDDFTYKFINDPYGALHNMDLETRLYGVREYHSDIESNWENEVNEGIEIINSGININELTLDNKSLSKINWEYITFNFRESKRKKQFFDNLDNNLKMIGSSLHVVKINDILQQWADPDIRKAIIDAYEKVNGNLNTNSMVLFSGVRDSNMLQWQLKLYDYCDCSCCCNYSKYFGCRYKKNGCLYTGDYEAAGKQKWNELKQAFSKYWDYIGCVQIPHHGSYKNYNQEFAMFAAYFVVSAGCQNKYGHPNGSVIKNLLLNNKYPMIVTEQQNSERIFNVQIKYGTNK